MLPHPQWDLQVHPLGLSDPTQVPKAQIALEQPDELLLGFFGEKEWDSLAETPFLSYVEHHGPVNSRADL